MTKSWLAYPMLCALVLAASIPAASLIPDAAAAPAAASPAQFDIRNNFADGAPTQVINDGWGDYIDSSLPGGDVCIDAFGGRANTFLAVNWSEADGYNCQPHFVRRFTLEIKVTEVCGELFAESPCRIISGPGTDDAQTGQYYGARSFRIRASDLFTSKATATRVDFLLERFDSSGVQRGFEIRTDGAVPFSVHGFTRTVANTAIKASLWKPNAKKSGWVQIGRSFDLPFEIAVTVP